MSCVLAFDTSNYTTSTACWQAGRMRQCRQLLPVAHGEKGLRQNDAVFHHTRQLPELMEQLGAVGRPDAVGCSVAPRDAADSYMPCFLVGAGYARSLAALFDCPCYRFSHQAGHVAAALWSAGREDLFDRPFFSFHFSGGTLEGLRVSPDRECIFSITTVAETADVSAGQIIDRVGVLLGLDFPCGAQLERLALTSERRFSPRVRVDGGRINLSGLQNLCETRLKQGESGADVARFCLDYLAAALRALSDNVTASQPELAVVYCGGVASDSIIRTALQRPEAVFAPAEYCTDNAVGIAVLTARKSGLWH